MVIVVVEVVWGVEQASKLVHASWACTIGVLNTEAKEGVEQHVFFSFGHVESPLHSLYVGLDGDNSS